jgi:hypothetical protein
MARAARQPAPRPAAEPARTPLGPHRWQGVTYHPCPAGAPEVRALYRFAGAFAPEAAPDEIAWAAEAGGRLCGGLLVERAGTHALVHGPVVVDPPPDAEPIEVAGQLVTPLLAHAQALGLGTIYARPQGLDRVWVRLGFVPLPEAFLPEPLRGRPGSGLHVWRRPGTYRLPAPEAEAGSRRRGRR